MEQDYSIGCAGFGFGSVVSGFFAGYYWRKDLENIIQRS